jgi:serine/threonine-protein kinase
LTLPVLALESLVDSQFKNHDDRKQGLAMSAAQTLWTSLMSLPSPASLEPVPDLEVVLTEAAQLQPCVLGRLGCPGALSVGRSRSANLILPADDRTAGRMHFVIELTTRFCRLENNAERGTFVNGLVVFSQCDLRHGDLIRAGKSVFRVELLRRGVPVELGPAPTMVFQPSGEVTSLAVEQPAAPTSLPMPVQLPGYQVIRTLGTGGMGTVYLAEDRAGKEVACKVIRPDRALDEDSCKRFRREANHLRDLSHRYIVGFREAGEYQGLLYLVMEYVPGSNLAQLLGREGPFAVGRAVRLVSQILEALGEAHTNGVVHRDVKPSNILVHEGPGGEEARLADFGLAKMYQSDDLLLTRPGVTGGTLAFASPEMVTDFRGAGPLSDQYGAAVTLYHLLTNNYLHDACHAVEMLDRIRHCDAVPLEQRRPGLPAELAAVIHRAVNREPRLRFPTVGSLRSALAPYAG